MSEKISVCLYDEKCVKCLHLFPKARNARAYTKCHYSRGNEACPAKELTFTKVSNLTLESRGEKLRKALSTGDFSSALTMIKRSLTYTEDERKVISRTLFKE